jgi:DNA end-binding protein Ku
MAAMRPAWRGMLKVGLVMVPCRMVAATDSSEKVRFNLLHAACHTRIQQKTWCPTCSTEISRSDTVRGHEYTKGQYVVVTDEELDVVADEASSTLDVTTVIDGPVNPFYIDGTLCLIPDPLGAAAFETVRVALEDRLAIGEVTIRGKACRVALEAVEQGFIVYRLRVAEQVRTFEDLDLPAAPTPSAADLAMARQLLGSYEGEFSCEELKDAYTARLRAFMASKVAAGGAVTAAVVVASAPAASSLTEALTRSLQMVRPAAKTVTAPVAVKRRKTAA